MDGDVLLLLLLVHPFSPKNISVRCLQHFESSLKETQQKQRKGLQELCERSHREATRTKIVQELFESGAGTRREAAGKRSGSSVKALLVSSGRALRKAIQTMLQKTYNKPDIPQRSNPKNWEAVMLRTARHHNDPKLSLAYFSSVAMACAP